ncbi:hydroxymethylbilane synthase [Hazenella sp. IB182357]|uniref:Porphobilinogen deaminase n=1 Tax=Polycladospora coralii TaxID=2771432 RepID=A0A926N8T6_9BACL|nr:hydroxymethylbilane synthase [Polycladospora coralii]MBD1371798.1 hydroxymethylbilane synthase [Polycladospora coralii]MBS7529259.1 hydroxymethylbilane synthase [Polycladospora coralii]
MNAIVVGTRRSQLALTQTQWVIDRLQEMDPNLHVSLEKIVTKGDRILDVTLSKVGGKGLFVKEIEQALLEKRIDFAVHSMKDMPGEMPDGLTIGAIPIRENPHDCFISQDGRALKEMPAGAVVGTSSLRRQSQILSLRPDLVVKPIRGNLGTRLDKLKNGTFDAIVLAVAGLARMNMSYDQFDELSVKEMLPAVGQGALAIQCRADDAALIERLAQINHEETARAVQAERSFLQSFQGGCHLPVAGYAEWMNGEIQLSGLIGDPEGKQMIYGAALGTDPVQVGKKLAQELQEQGAEDLLDRVRNGLVG